MREPVRRPPRRRVRALERRPGPEPSVLRDGAVAELERAPDSPEHPLFPQSRLGSQATMRLLDRLRARAAQTREELARPARRDAPGPGMPAETAPSDLAAPEERAPAEAAAAPVGAAPEPEARPEERPAPREPEVAQGAEPPPLPEPVESEEPVPSPAPEPDLSEDLEVAEAAGAAAPAPEAAAGPQPPEPEEAAAEGEDAAAAAQAAVPLAEGDAAPPASSSEIAEAQGEAPASEGPGEAARLEPGPEVRAWRSRVVAGAEAIPVPHLARAPQAAGAVRAQGGALRDQRAPRREMIPDEADAAVPDPPEAVDPPPAPPPDPVPAANELVEAEAGHQLSDAVMPDMARSPRGTQPLVRDPAARRPETAGQRAAEGALAPDETGEGAAPGRAEPTPEDQAAVDAVDEAAQTPAPEPIPGTAEGVTITDEPPAPPEPLPPPLSNIMREVIARLLLNPREQAAPLIEQAREDAYPDGVLSRVYGSIGNDRLDGLTETLTDGLRRVAEQAGIAAEDLEAAVDRRRAEVEAEAQAAVAEVASAAGEEAEAAETASGEEVAEVEAAEAAQNARTVVVVSQAQGEGSPEVIELRRDQQIRKVNRRVGDLAFGYEQAEERRHDALDRAMQLQARGYDETARDDQRAIEAAAEDPGALQVRLEKAAIRLWAEERKRAVEAHVVERKSAATREADGFIAAVRAAGSTATAQIRDWASEQLGETRSWWDELWALFTDWSQRAEAEADNWATVRAGEARDATIANMSVLNAFVESQGEDIDVEQSEAFAQLSQEQQAVIRAYYAAPPDSRDALGAVAAGLRFRLGAQQKPVLIDAMKREVLDKPDSEWGRLNEIGQAQSPGFNAAAISPQLYDAMFGGLTGWGTEEDDIYNALSGLTPEQGRAVRAHYAFLYKGRDLDRDLASELDADNALIRARAALDGDPVMVAVGALNEAMSGLGTDEDTIMQVLRGKTAEQRARIVEEYRRQYNVDLEAALRDDLSSHDLDRADALMAGDTARADAIAVDQAMHGGMFGWGTDEAAIEGVYAQIRREVAAMEVPDGQGGRRPLTAEEMEAEIARRSLEVEASYNTEYGSAEDQESALRAAYRDELSGPRLDLANALADNDLAAADAARIEIENRGVYTDDDVVNGILEDQYSRALDALRRDPVWRARREALREQARRENWDPYQLANAERELERDMEQAARAGGEANMRALEERYDSEYSRWGSGGLQVVIAFNMSGADQAKARALVEQGGYLNRAQQVDFATRGAGTDEAALDRALAGLTAVEIAELDEDIRRLRPGETLEGIVTSELTGREEFDATMRLRGEPENADQEMEQARMRAEWELQNSDIPGEQRQALERSLADLERQHRLMNDPDAPASERAAARRQFMSRAGGVDSTVQSYRNQVDAVADAAATVAALTVGITVTVLTGGVAGAVLGALYAAAATMATKAAIKGGAYGGDEMALDAVVGVVDGFAAAATFGIGNALVRVAATQGARVTRMGGTRLAATLGRMAASGSRAQRMIAHGIAEGVEGAASAVPAALTANLMDDKNWENGNPLANIARGTLMEVGMGAAAGGTLGSIGGVRRPQPAAPPSPRTGDMLAHRGTPKDRLDAWRAHRAENPDANMRDFLRDYDAQVSARLAAEGADAATQRALRGELLAGIPPRQRRQFADTPIEVMPDDEFFRFTRSRSANAVTVIEKGRPRVIMRESAPASALREEGIHLRQIAEPDLGRLARRLDEAELRNWDDLSLGEQLELYSIKLELEIDAQRRLIAGLDADIRSGGPDVDLGALHRQRAAAADSLDALSRRAAEVADLGPLERIAMSRGILDPPQYLDQPARLFQKLRSPPVVRAAPRLPRRAIPLDGPDRSPLAGSGSFVEGQDRVMQIGREWIEPKRINLRDGAEFTTSDGTAVVIRNGRPVRKSNGRPLAIADGTMVTLPGGRQVALKNGNSALMDVRYREVEVIGPDGTVKAVRQEAMSVSHTNLAEGGWVQRGSESLRIGTAAEAASMALSHQRVASGEALAVIKAQQAGGSGFDGVELRLNGKGEPVIGIVEVKHHRGYVPFEEFSAVTVNLRQNLASLEQLLTPPPGLVRRFGMDEALRRHAAQLKAAGVADLTPAQLGQALDAIHNRRVELDIRLGPGTKVGKQGSDSTFNRLWNAWRVYGGSLGIKGRKKPRVRDPDGPILPGEEDLSLSQTDIDAAAAGSAGATPPRVGTRPAFYDLIGDVPPGQRITDRQLAEARIATLGTEVASAPPHAGKLSEPLGYLGQPAPFQDAAGRPLAVQQILPGDIEGDRLEPLVDMLADRLRHPLIMPDGSHAPLSLALGLSNLSAAQRARLLQALEGRLAGLPGGPQALARVIPVIEPI